MDKHPETRGIILNIWYVILRKRSCHILLDRVTVHAHPYFDERPGKVFDGSLKWGCVGWMLTQLGGFLINLYDLQKRTLSGI